MRPLRTILGFSSLVVFLASVSYGATITGAVKGPDGAPFRAAFVEAQNAKTKITTIVLSGERGHYEIPNLPAGEYALKIRAVGYTAAPQSSVNLTASQDASYDFALQKGMVRWADISKYQARHLLPEDRGKNVLFGQCFACHDFQSRMASVGRNEDGWKDRVEYMKQVAHYFLYPNFDDKKGNDVAYYINHVFGTEDTVLPKSPVDMPDYNKYVQPPVSGEALNVVYVEYELPGPNRMPWSAAPAKDGTLWIPYFGSANKVGNLNPTTGEVKEFPVPFKGPAFIHSAIAAPDGTVWLSEQAANAVARLDPKTGKVTEYQDYYLPGHEGTTIGGEIHTARIDARGNVWLTGKPFRRFDPETNKFTRYDQEVPTSYGQVFDKDGNLWITEQTLNGKVCKVDVRTGKITKYAPTADPANLFPHRIDIDSQGTIWITERRGDKLGSLDPKTGVYKDYDLPGPETGAYAVGADKNGYIWYSGDGRDEIGRLDPKTGHVVVYPFPHPELSMREFLFDAQGRMWWASPANNKVGYMYLVNTKVAENR